MKLIFCIKVCVLEPTLKKGIIDSKTDINFYKYAVTTELETDKGHYFRKKLWCCVGGECKQMFGFINQSL